jgi:hypothetical protein
MKIIFKPTNNLCGGGFFMKYIGEWNGIINLGSGYSQYWYCRIHSPGKSPSGDP